MEGEKEKREGGRREKKRREEEGEGKKACQLTAHYAHPSHTCLDLLLIYIPHARRLAPSHRRPPPSCRCPASSSSAAAPIPYFQLQLRCSPL